MQEIKSESSRHKHISQKLFKEIVKALIALIPFYTSTIGFNHVSSSESKGNCLVAGAVICRSTIVT